MQRELAKELKIAGFPMPPYRAGHHFYPHEDDAGWTDAARRHGVTVTHFDLEDRLPDLKNGYYCPNLSDLIEACGARFSRLTVMKTLWTAESDSPEQIAMGDSPEEAVGRLWLLLNAHRSPDIRPAAQSGLSARAKAVAADHRQSFAQRERHASQPLIRSAARRSD